LRESVHDNWIYAQAVDHERRRIVLHTVYPHVEPSEYTDVVFEGVVVHHFEQQRLGSSSEAANILFDVEETDSFFVLRSYETLLVSTRDYGWPVLRYENLNDLVAQLTADGAKCFEVHGTLGLHGFVFAQSVEFRARQARVEVVA